MKWCRRGENMRTCIICGNENPKTNPCDPVCTRARNAGMSREERMAFEVRRAGVNFKRKHCKVCGMLNSECFCYYVEGNVNQV